MFARRRQVQPDVIRSVEGAPHRRNDRDSTWLPRCAKARASHHTTGPIEPDTRTTSRSSKRPRAAARKTTLDETDTNLLQTTRMFKGARCLPSETANMPQPLVEPRVPYEPREKIDSVLSV